ncbi:sugar ABC transporter ATP-binding protein [Mesorhizobium sp. L-8-3]|uniref:sugar ABC transporter ATP-binding protein n=1 Tax=Mesorhizobium sp. L-8-3 TaxID=2744522 RepID=UPI0019292130|nr:sugar ABC transporter ATP-binding protein [Mesorhizobium sp. L-8-3]BCH24122.1 ribose ABC transporter [Mesorhizobium sp. L-8-3]
MLDIRDLSKSFGGVAALDGVALSVAAGRVHALLGENGAGKSTLLKCLSGAQRPDRGEMRLLDKNFEPASPRDAEAAGLRFVHQELNLVPGFTAYENAFVGRRYPKRFGLIDRRAMRGRMCEVRDRLGLDLPLDVPVRRLSLSQRQLVEILRALMDDARLLVLDEPTASLSEAEATTLRGVVRSLAAAGCAVVFVSHRMDEVFELAEDFTVLRNGRTVGQGRLADTDRDGIVAMMAGSALSHERPATPPAASGPAVLRLEGFAAGPGRRRIDLGVSAGEIVGLYGIIGAGRSSLLTSIWGASPEAVGTITLAGKRLPPSGIAERIAAGVAFAPEDRRSTGLIMAHSVLDNAVLPNLGDHRAVPVLPVLSPGSMRRGAEAMLAATGVKFGRLSDRIATLSGGNQQKVLIGRWLSDATRLLLLDEPTRGVDVRSKAEIHALCRGLAARGTPVIFATSDIEELFMLAGRIVVLAHGAVVLDAPAETLGRQDVLAATFSEAGG